MNKVHPVDLSACNWIACAVIFISSSRDNSVSNRQLDELWYPGTAMLVPIKVAVLSPCGSTSDRRSSERFTWTSTIKLSTRRAMKFAAAAVFLVLFTYAVDNSMAQEPFVGEIRLFPYNLICTKGVDALWGSALAYYAISSTFLSTRYHLWRRWKNKFSTAKSKQGTCCKYLLLHFPPRSVSKS